MSKFVPINHFSTIVVPQRVPFLWICASKGIDLGPNFVVMRVGVLRCSPSRGIHFPGEHPQGNFLDLINTHNL